jgi:hypothetical protein
LLEIGWCSLWKKEHAPAMQFALPFVNPTSQRNDTAIAIVIVAIAIYK